MRRALLMLTLALVVTMPTWSQSLQEMLLGISTDLTRISETFDRELQTLENQLLSFRNESTQILEQLSTQLDALEPRVESSEESLADLRSSFTGYRTYAQTALETQAARIDSLETEVWIYRIGGGLLAALVLYLAIR